MSPLFNKGLREFILFPGNLESSLVSSRSECLLVQASDYVYRREAFRAVMVLSKVLA